MNWDALGAIGEVVGSLAVVVTLFFLISQLKQGSQATRSNTIAVINESIHSYLRVSCQAPELAQIWAKVESDGYDSLNVAEEFQIRGFNAALIYSFNNAFDQVKLGTLTQQQWEPYRDLLIGLLGQRPNREFWDRYKAFYPQPFRDEVDQLLS